MGFENINIIEDAEGASQQTANQDKLSYKGVEASQQMAKTDLVRMTNYKTMIREVGKEYGIDPALIARIISRESRAGNTLENGWGDNGRAWGLMQVDVTSTGGRHTPEGDWNSKKHLQQGTRILVYFIEQIRKKTEFKTEAQILKGAIAAYNMGDGNVHSYQNVDVNTTGGDYSNDVVVRAQWFKKHLFC